MVVVFVDSDQHFFVSLDKLTFGSVISASIFSALFYFIFCGTVEKNLTIKPLCLWLLLSFSLLSLSLHGHILKTVT